MAETESLRKNVGMAVSIVCSLDKWFKKTENLQTLPESQRIYEVLKECFPKKEAFSDVSKTSKKNPSCINIC